MHRRTVLRNGAVAGALVAAGCFGVGARWGANPTLTLRNRLDETVTLGLTVHRLGTNAGEPRRAAVVHESTVEVPAQSTGTRNVLGDDAFEVVVRWRGRVVTVFTVPQCNEASTRVTVTADGRLRGRSVPCEGNPSEFTATAANESADG